VESDNGERASVESKKCARAGVESKNGKRASVESGRRAGPDEENVIVGKVLGRLVHFNGFQHRPALSGYDFPRQQALLGYFPHRPVRLRDFPHRPVPNYSSALSDFKNKL
jgi:hypothetical protein